MGSLVRSARLVTKCLTTCLILTASLAAPVFAAETTPATPAPAAPALTSPPLVTPPAEIVPDPSAWQNVITGQIEAFRHGDAPTAFGFAAAPFQTAFPDAVTFMESIAASGYTPIFAFNFRIDISLSPPNRRAVVRQVGVTTSAKVATEQR